MLVFLNYDQKKDTMYFANKAAYIVCVEKNDENGQKREKVDVHFQIIDGIIY